MRRFMGWVSVACVVAILAATGPLAALADAPPLVTVRFNQPRVYFDQQLYGAISKAVSLKPDVLFDVIACAPATGNAEVDKQWQAVASRNTRAIVKALNEMGVPMSRITVTGKSLPGLAFDETQIFAR